MWAGCWGVGNGGGDRDGDGDGEGERVGWWVGGEGKEREGVSVREWADGYSGWSGYSGWIQWIDGYSGLVDR